MNLRKQILKSFPKNPRPKHSLSDAITADDWGDPKNTFTEKWNDWTEIEDWQVNDCPYVFYYLEFKDKLYYLPRFMVFMIDDMNGDVSKELDADISIPVFNWVIGNWMKIKEEIGIAKMKLLKEFLILCKNHIYFQDSLEATGIDPELYQL